jgi:hypothetical protein
LSFQQVRVLDPIERVSEALFGLIMVLTFTGSLSVANPSDRGARDAGRRDRVQSRLGHRGCRDVRLASVMARAVVSAC